MELYSIDMVRNAELESGESVADRITSENENFRLFYRAHNYVHFKVDVHHSQGRLLPDELEQIVPDGWETQQWKNRATEINLTIHR